VAKVGPLFMYKLRFFFGPALRSRIGPLAYVGLILLFVPTGFGVGMGIGTSLKGSSLDHAIDLLSTPLAGILSVALLYSLGAGVTAHASEFDFFMTARVKPREYLVSDLLFQFASLFGAGGLAAAVAALGIAVGVGRPLWDAVPLVLLLLAYAFLLLFTIQVFVILRVKYPKAHLRAITGILLAVSLLPAVSLALPSFPLRFEGVPFPSSAFGTLAADVLLGRPLDLVAASLAAVYVIGLAAAWLALSNTYIFHGIRPSLSAGFGQVDMAARMDQQRRIMSGLGGLTTRVHMRADRGGDTSLMTRLHLLRIWRDGSILFVGIFALITLISGTVSTGAPGSQQAPTPYLTTEIITLLMAVLALNWSYYERENLWMVLMGRHAPGAYFRGLMASFAAIGFGVAAVLVVLLQIASPSPNAIQDAALPLAAPIAAAFASAALLTRLNIKPSAFSASMLVILVAVPITGFMAGLAAQGVVLAARILLGLGDALQAAFLAVFVVGLTAAGLWAVSRLGASFHL